MLRMSSSVGLLMPSLPNHAGLQRPVPSVAEARASTAAVSTCIITLDPGSFVADWYQGAQGWHIAVSLLQLMLLPQA